MSKIDELRRKKLKFCVFGKCDFWIFWIAKKIQKSHRPKM